MFIPLLLWGVYVYCECGGGEGMLDVNVEFERALHWMEETQKFLFITGKAGTGKSTLLDYFCNQTQKRPVVLAPTGVAALNVKGQTIHRFFHFHKDITPEKVYKKDIVPRDIDLYKKLSMIIIDEVSMLRADLLDCIDIFLKIYGPHASQPFGGVQLVFVGDLYQLPPVVPKDKQEIFQTEYSSSYFFSAKALESVDLEIIELEQVYRQEDNRFVDLLNKIRNNSITMADIEKLNQRYFPHADIPPEDSFIISLTTTNKQSDNINAQRLNRLEGSLYSFKAFIQGDFAKDSYPTAEDLQFKIGAQIMLVNNDPKRRWVNGSIGIIEDVKYSEDCEEDAVCVRLQDHDHLLSVFPFVWDSYGIASEESGDKDFIMTSLGSFRQYPFRLAWAVTIHKSQGKTFDRVVIDIGEGAFACGQIYVAMSRCRSLEGISLKVPIQKKHIKTDYRIGKFFASTLYKAALENFSFETKISMISQAMDQKAALSMSYINRSGIKFKRIVFPLSVTEKEYEGKKYMGMRAYYPEEDTVVLYDMARILTLQWEQWNDLSGS